METQEEQKIHLYSNSKSSTLYQGNMLDMLDVIEPNSIDAIVTDPPYELNFMNKGWDNSGIAFQKETWERCFQVLKPGGYMLTFGGTRTFHRIACAIEDAGFEIRDTIMYLYGSGFPKSLNIGLAIDKKNGVESEVIGTAIGSVNAMPDGRSSRSQIAWERESKEYEIKKAQNEWGGWGTSLKPAYEPIIIARKPCEGSCIDNVIKYGVGGINIDECRVGVEERTYKGAGASPQKIDNHEKGDTGIGMLNGSGKDNEYTVNGRYPANVVLTYDETDKDEVCGGMPESKSGVAVRHNSGGNTFGGDNKKPQMNDLGYFDEGSAARYYYCAKASKRDRDEGLEAFSTQKTGDLQGGRQEGSAGSLRVRSDGSIGVNPYADNGAPKKNTHPTVKPTDLMQYLVRLVTPKGGTVLDPFNGSGSTGKAVAYENFDRDAGYKYIGIELSEEYLAISAARIKYVESLIKQIKLF